MHHRLAPGPAQIRRGAAVGTPRQRHEAISGRLDVMGHPTAFECFIFLIVKGNCNFPMVKLL
jgi:hypothetical protein